MDVKLHCQHCGERIGVYEPLVMLVDGQVRETSRAAEPQHAGAAGSECYHRDCYQRLRGDGPLPT